MSPYIIMFAHFLISLVVIFFVYKALVNHEKLKANSTQIALASLSLTLPAFLITFLRVPAIAGVVIGAVILFFLQKAYIKDDKTNALLALKSAIVLIFVIILILFASSLILR